ncbi:MAG: BACON domain-containing protein [Bacteroidales bacterium]|nr:BACON domain-containing protein [Bacteroidales bacterium]
MKKEFKVLKIMFFTLLMLGFAGCKKEKITLSRYELWFPSEASVQDIQLTANCDWTVSIDDGADWYTIRRSYDKTVMTENGYTTVSVIDTTQILTGGSGDMRIAVVVDPLEGASERSSNFTITSAKGKVQLRVSISQNTTQPVELQSITNMVFGVMNVAHWNVDYFGEVIEDSYRELEFDPTDTTTGYFMYFLEEGQGVQRDNTHDSTLYFLFTYNYDPAARNLHIEFETVSDTIPEVYDAPVLTATVDLFHFCHEYKPNFWERADMKKVGNITTQRKEFLYRNAKKRKGGDPIFMF